MSLPKQLIKSFDNILQTELVQLKQCSQKNINEFVIELNKAIPDRSNTHAFMIYKFNRNKYAADKARFIKDITNFEYYRSMILWTDYSDILQYFDLKNKIFLGWDNIKNYYHAHPLNAKSTKSTLPSSEQTWRVLRKGEKIIKNKSRSRKSSIDDNNRKSDQYLIETANKSLESVDGQLDQLYDRIAEKRKLLIKQLHEQSQS